MQKWMEWQQTSQFMLRCTICEAYGISAAQFNRRSLPIKYSSSGAAGMELLICHGTTTPQGPRAILLSAR